MINMAPKIGFSAQYQESVGHIGKEQNIAILHLRAKKLICKLKMAGKNCLPIPNSPSLKCMVNFPALRNRISQHERKWNIL